MSIQYLVLVLNGRSDQKIKFSLTWLDYLNHMTLLKDVAVVLLGDEKCNNDWILPYMTYHGGKVKVVFLTYDSPLVDNIQFYQWPLGVATYRNFPNYARYEIQPRSPRHNLCNFIGTVYQGSSRQTIVDILTSNSSLDCLLLPRYRWQPKENEESLSRYISILLNSDLTLAPIGINSESYRIYEALSCGSIPVVEDVMSDGNCSCTSQQQRPFRLLKAYNAPLVYLTNWQRELQFILHTHKQLPYEQKVNLRQQALDWYHNFKMRMKEKFISVIKLHIIH